jgi:hypothetical protein
MMNKEQLTSNESRIDYIFKIMNEEKHVYFLDLQLDSIWLRMNISGENVEGNSNPNQLKPGILSRSLLQISKKHLKVHMSPVGDVIDVSDADTLFHAVINGYRQVPEQVRTAIMDALDIRFGITTIQLELQNILNIYSSKSVKPNSQWKIDVPLSGGLTGITENNYTLNNLTSSEFNISSEGKIEPPAVNDFQKINGILMKYELNGNKTAEYRVDAMNGWIHFANVKELINGTVRMQGSPAMPEGISWPISMQWIMECSGSKLR